MKKNSKWFLYSFLIFTGMACQKSKPVSLAVDFTTQDLWRYRFSCTISGTFAFSDSVSTLSSSISSLLIGKSADHKDRLHITTDSVSISSNTLDPDEVRHMTERMMAAEYTLALTPDPSRPLEPLMASTAGEGLEMDIYRQLIKVLPSLPDKPVSPGFAWEREKQFPVSTSQGKASCDLYQSFTFDSLRTGVRGQEKAHISWRFRYTVDAAQFDTASLMQNLPLSGSGIGSAVLDIAARSLLRADMLFTTPACSLNQVTVGWEEKARLLLSDEQVSSGSAGP